MISEGAWVSYGLARFARVPLLFTFEVSKFVPDVLPSVLCLSISSWHWHDNCASVFICTTAALLLYAIAELYRTLHDFATFYFIESSDSGCVSNTDPLSYLKWWNKICCKLKRSSLKLTDIMFLQSTISGILYPIKRTNLCFALFQRNRWTQF